MFQAVEYATGAPVAIKRSAKRILHPADVVGLKQVRGRRGGTVSMAYLLSCATCCLVLLVVLWALVASLVASLYCNECGASNGADKLMVSCVCLLPVRCFCRACWRQEIEILNEVEAANALRLAFSGSITFAFACALCAASPPTCCDAVRVL